MMDFSISTNWMIILGILVAWEILWKAIALWQAAKNDQPVWFGALLLINTAGVFPILYLMFNASQKHPINHAVTR